MASVTRFDIWTDQIYRINNLIEELKYTSSTLREATCENIVNRLCDAGFEVAESIALTMPSNNLETSTVSKDVNGNTGELSLNGSGAVYDEFGTGEEGAENPHPLKNNYGLNPYNSGPFVSTHINPFNNRHYWIYPPMSGKPYFDLFGIPGYTEGIPAGMPMYNALNEIKKIKDEVVQDEISKAIKTLK